MADWAVVAPRTPIEAPHAPVRPPPHDRRPIGAPSAPAAPPLPFEITNNKPFVEVTIGGARHRWFILDTGCQGSSIIAQDYADRLRLGRGAAARVDVGAGAGADVGLSRGSDRVTLRTLGRKHTVDEPPILTLGHVARYEGRRVDGLLGGDFLARHVVEIDYAGRTIAVRDPDGFEPPPGAVEIPLDLESGWPIARGTITPPGGAPIPCRLIIDTGLRGVVTLFRPFSSRHGLYDSPGSRHDLVVGGGAGGLSRGDVGRLDALALGSLSFARPIAVLSRDTSGVFSLGEPQGIVGGELLRRHRVTFDYPHGRMLLEPYADGTPFEYDMSGLFLAADGRELATIRILSVHPNTPGAEAGLRDNDEIVAIDGRRGPKLTLDDARILLRQPGGRRMEIRRAGQKMEVTLEARRLI